MRERVHVLAHKMGWIWLHAKVNPPAAEDTLSADRDDMHHSSFLLCTELVLLLTNQSLPNRSVWREKLWLQHFVSSGSWLVCFGFFFFGKENINNGSSWLLSEAGLSKLAQVNL